jgi:hypothetical protein
MKDTQSLMNPKFLRTCTAILAASVWTVSPPVAIGQQAPPISNQLEVVLESMPEERTFFQPTSSTPPAQSLNASSIDLPR